jgi:hypothetical protein
LHSTIVYAPSPSSPQEATTLILTADNHAHAQSLAPLKTAAYNNPNPKYMFYMLNPEIAVTM